MTSFFDQLVLTYSLCCCHGQQAPFQSNDNLFNFGVTGSKAREIAGDEESCPWLHRNVKSKTSSTKLRRALLKW